MFKIFTLFGLSFLLQSCVAVPSTSPSVNNGVKPHEDFRQKYAKRLSVDSIKQNREKTYGQKLAALKRLNPVQDAQRAAAADGYYFLAYQTGRGGMLKTPGLTQQQSISKRCGLKMLDGMGDVIYGENHRQYRNAIRDYAGRFNRTMFAFCQ